MVLVRGLKLKLKICFTLNIIEYKDIGYSIVEAELYAQEIVKKVRDI
jgi:hypothetical protein